MKRIVIILAAILLTITMFAQEKTDSIKVKIGTSTFIIVPDKNTGKDTLEIIDGDTIKISCDKKNHKKDKFDGHWAGFDFGVNGYLNNNSLTLNSADQYLNLNQTKSWNFSFNFAEINIPIIKKYLGLVSGMGFQFNNYRFDNNIRLISDSSVLTYYDETTVKYEKNKLVATYLNIPLLLELQIPLNGGSDNLHLTTGVVGGLLIGSHTKQVFEINGHKGKEKQREDFHLSPFAYAVTARIGYNNVSLYANYNLAQLFKSNEGPELYPWSAGISLSF